MRSRLFVALIAVLVTALAVASVAGAFSGAKRVTTLSGAEEAPGPGDPDGSGFSVITLNVGQATVCWDTTVRDIMLPATASHIHIAPAGVAGPVIVPLSPPDASGHASGCRTADPGLIQDIIDRPEAYYVNVHTDDFPAGAVRGQLSNRGQSN